MCHDDPDWPEGFERTLSSHQDLDEAIETLHAAGADNTRQLSERGDRGGRGAALALAVLGPAGATVMCVRAGLPEPPATDSPTPTSSGQTATSRSDPLPRPCQACCPGGALLRLENSE